MPILETSGDAGFQPIKLAISLQKGYAKEYRDRNWFNQVYFNKLSMYHALEGYIPILYRFEFRDTERRDYPVPENLLMTYYYPQKRKMSNLNGIIVIGGHPDISNAYSVTKVITPQLESLSLTKHAISHEFTQQMIDESLNMLAKPPQTKEIVEILKKSMNKNDEQLSTFYPILADPAYETQKLGIPNDFHIDGVFVFKVTEDFFSGTDIGKGILSLSLYHSKSATNIIKPDLAFPLIFKWQPVYNDILIELIKEDSKILPPSFSGQLIPSIILFNHRDTKDYTALIATVNVIEDQLYYCVAIAKTGHTDGRPLSLLSSALRREKFGQEKWLKIIENRHVIAEDSVRNQEYELDLISTDLIQVVAEINLTADGVFDLGILESIELEE